MEKEKLGIFLAQLRKDRKLTQKELADKLYVSVSTISKWEQGVSTPNIYFLEKIAEALGVSTAELVEREVQREAETVEQEIAFEDSVTVQHEALGSQNHLAGQPKHSENQKEVSKPVQKRLRRIFCILMTVVIAVIVAIFSWHCYRISRPLEMKILESFYIADSDFYGDNIYFVVVEYDGRLTDEEAISYAKKLQGNYEKWFDMADGIIFVYFDNYKGKENLMEADNKVVFVPYKGP